MLANGVLENANNPGTGTFTLAGAPTGRSTFLQAFASGAVVYYAATDGTQNEFGFGTLTSGPPTTLSRNVISNSAGTTAALNFTGALQVFSGIPAERALWAGPDNAAVLAGNRKLSGLVAGTAVDHAPRLDQVGWERISSTVFTATQSAVVFSLPTAYDMFMVEWQNVFCASTNPMYCRFSQDGGASYIAGSTSYYENYDVLTAGSSASAAGTQSYFSITPGGAGAQWGQLRFEPVRYTLQAIGVSGASGGINRLTGVGNVASASARLTHVLLGNINFDLYSGSFRLLGGRF